MSDIRNNALTQELTEVLDYMEKILVNEFPCKEFTPEHLIISLLDKCNSHAYYLLDNWLMTQNLKQLRDIYVNYLREQTEHENGYVVNGNKTIKYNEDLDRIMENAVQECEGTQPNSNKIIGSEHILLSMLSPKTNNEKIQEVFKNVGIEYTFIKNKCFETKPNKINKKNHKTMKPNFVLPLKSEINTKGVANKTNYIKQFTISLTQMAKEGKIDDLIGRKEELNQIIRTMARRNKNNVVLVGKGGCGKTQMVNGLAKMIVENKVPEFLRNKDVVKLNIMALVSGTHFRGMFEERVNGLFEELKASRRYILFIDDMQGVLKNGTKDKDTDLAPMLSDILNGNEVQVIGAINFKDYRNAIESNSSLSRKFQKIVIEPTNVKETIDILIGNKNYYEDYHNVYYPDDVLKSCAELSYRYITDRSLPDSAIDVLDLVGADTCFTTNDPEEIAFAKTRLLEIGDERIKYLNEGDFEYSDKLSQEENHLKLMIAQYNRERNDERKTITYDDVANIISNITKIPVSRLTLSEKKKIVNIENILKSNIVGQDEAIENVSKVIKRNRIGLGDKSKCMGALLLVGPSGTGKTLLAKKLAEEVFGDENALVRLDMSEYSEKSSVSKLIGASSGYVGYENGGQLTEAIKNKPYCVLLLDELEKSDNEVQNMFLQVLDDGRITDNTGQIVSFKNVIILMTSNVGAQKANQFGGGIGFINDKNENTKAIIEKELKKKFTPEFLNRIDKIVHFNSLSKDNIKDIVRLELNIFNKRLNEIGYSVNYNDEVVNYIHQKAVEESEYGARPIKRIIQNLIEDKITEELLINEYDEGYEFTLIFNDNQIKIKTVKK